MKSIKIMLLGIALLIIAVCGVLMWKISGATVGKIMFFAGLALGTGFCLMGFFTKEQ